MTIGSWVFMIIVWSIIIVLNVFCFTKMFRKKS